MSVPPKPITQSDFDDLYRKYRRHFIAISRMYVRDEIAAEDIMTESFMAFWEKRDTIKTDNYSAYIHTTVKNRSLRWLRDRRKHDEVHRNIHSDASREIIQQIGFLETTLPKTLLFREVSDIIEATLRKMPERMRRIFLAHRIEEMSYKEIEQLYALSKGQISNQLQRANEWFALALKDYIALVVLFLLLY